MKIKRTLVAGTAALALSFSLAACSDDDGGDDTSTDTSTGKSSATASAEESAPEEAATEEAATEEAATEEAGDTVSTGGETSVKVEGKDLSGLDLDSVTCVKQGGRITVGSAAIGGQEGLGVLMTDEETPQVEALSMVVDDIVLAVSSAGGAQVGSAEVSVDGSTYTITGEATGADTTDPSAGMISKEFEVTVDCD